MRQEEREGKFDPYSVYRSNCGLDHESARARNAKTTEAPPNPPQAKTTPHIDNTSPHRGCDLILLCCCCCILSPASHSSGLRLIRIRIPIPIPIPIAIPISAVLVWPACLCCQTLADPCLGPEPHSYPRLSLWRPFPPAPFNCGDHQGLPPPANRRASGN